MGLFKPTSSDTTRDFYENLSKGVENRGVWGMDTRFDADGIGAKSSVQKYFEPVIRPYFKGDEKCVDLGCGPGGFLLVAAKYCREIVGADIVPAFVKECSAAIERAGMTHASTVLLQKGPLPFADASVDTVMMVDTIHHLEDAPATMKEVARILKPGGTFLIFEPNKLNPLLALMCLLDRNEHGLLALGTFGSYRRLLKDDFSIEHGHYSGLLVGPENKLFLRIADWLAGPLRPVFGWLCPKLFIAARKK